MTSPPPPTVRQTVWDFDPVHSRLGFAVLHLGLARVQGRFRRWTGVMHLDDQHPERSSVDVRIESASIETGEPMRDAHLRSAGFLDAVRFPEIEFRSTGLHRADDVLFQLAGDLTIFGRARSVVLEVAALGVTRDPAGNQRAGFSARTAIERHEFGLEWNEGGAGQEALVGDEIEVWIELEAMERSERPAVPPVAEPAAAG